MRMGRMVFSKKAVLASSAGADMHAMPACNATTKAMGGKAFMNDKNTV